MESNQAEQSPSQAQQSLNGPSSNTKDTSPSQGDDVSADVTENLIDVELHQLALHLDSVVGLPKQPPTWLDAFLGVCFDKRRELLQALVITEKERDNLTKQLSDNPSPIARENITQHLNRLNEIQKAIRDSLDIYTISTPKKWLYQWSVVSLLLFTTVFLVIVVEIYVRWHGTTILGNLNNLYNEEQVALLSQITFANGATTLSIAFEILAWSSVGVWAQQAYANTQRMLNRTFRFADHGPMYIGVMMRNTGIAAAVILLLRLAQFSVFGISLDDSNPYAFDATIGFAFILGFFGDDTIKVLSDLRDAVLGNARRHNNIS